MARTRKRKRPNYYEADIDSACIELPEQEEDEEQKDEVLVEHVQSLAQAEAEDLEDLTSIASEATVIEFDSRTGRPIRLSSSNDDSDSNERDDDGSPIDGIAKISKAMMLENDPDLFHDLSRIHSIVKQKIHLKYMVPWAGVGGDSTRLRAFGFLGKRALTRLDRGSDVRLHAPEKEGQEALQDERANRRAICVLHKTRELVVGVDDQRQSTTKDKDNEISRTAPQTVNPTLVADRLCATILTNKNNGDTNHYLDSNMLCSKELIAYQTNLHNGAKHLAAHLDAPLHEGFGKIIVTVAMKGSATILLIGKGDDEDDDEDEDEEHTQDNNDDKSDQQLQPAWKFHLQEGEAYVLSRNARNMCLHAVVANDDANGGDRESLNLRFGLHTIKEAENDIKRHWPDLW